MKFISLAFTFCFCLLLNAQADYCSQANEMLLTAQKHHYAPPEFNSEFNQLVADKFISTIDPYKLYFTQSNRSELRLFFSSSTEKVLQGNCDLISQLTPLFDQRIKDIKQHVNQLTASNINYKSSDSIKFNASIACQSEKELYKRWEKFMQVSFLQSYLSVDSINEHNWEGFLKKKKADFATELEQMNCMIDGYLDSNNSTSTYITEQYLAALSSAFDPHSAFFKADIEAAFNSSLSKTSLSFGIQFNRNKLGEVEVAYLSPGGAAYNSNKIEEGDVLEYIKGDKIEINGNCIDDDQMMHLYYSDKIKEADFSFRKKDGKTINVQLNKTEVKVDENIVQAYILKGKSNIGYINLPSFYGSEDPLYSGSRGAARDVAKKLIKLQLHQADALIFDLRDNGGGNMDQATQLVGMFIDYGIVSATQDQNGEIELVKDFDRGKIFSKPLVVLINSRSASASEFFAGAIQNYNRGILVGDTTLGKASMQVVLPIEANKYEMNDPALYQLETEAYTKITIGMFYRPNGESHQLNGVIPDIVLPQLYSNEGESGYKNALKAKPLTKDIHPRAEVEISLDKILANHKVRLDSNQYWKSLVQYSNFLGKTHFQTKYPLNFESFKNYLSESDRFKAKLKGFGATKVFEVETVDRALDQEFSDKRLEELIDNIYKDQEIQEAFYISQDLIK